MASEVTMPRLSDSMEEGTILKWLVEEGGEVKRGEPLVEIETDKANMTYEADADGTLVEIVAEEGDTLPIGDLIAKIGDAGEASSNGGGGDEGQEEAEAKGAEEEDEGQEEAEAKGARRRTRARKKLKPRAGRPPARRRRTTSPRGEKAIARIPAERRVPARRPIEGTPRTARREPPPPPGSGPQATTAPGMGGSRPRR